MPLAAAMYGPPVGTGVRGLGPEAVFRKYHLDFVIVFLILFIHCLSQHHALDYEKRVRRQR